MCSVNYPPGYIIQTDIVTRETDGWMDWWIESQMVIQAVIQAGRQADISIHAYMYLYSNTHLNTSHEINDLYHMYFVLKVWQQIEEYMVE